MSIETLMIAQDLMEVEMVRLRREIARLPEEDRPWLRQALANLERSELEIREEITKLS